LTELVANLHDRLVVGRRARVLSAHLAALIPRGARVLDVGCGDGAIDRLLLEQRPDITVEGIDVLVRPECPLPMQRFDGAVIPYADDSFDTVTFVDALHHTADPLVLLKEALRVGRTIVIKDHFREGWLAAPVLRLMDWAGNAHHGVALPYNYWSKSQWLSALGELHVGVAEMRSSLGLYPPPASWLFERGLHFACRLEPRAAEAILRGEISKPPSHSSNITIVPKQHL
jgi:SAM-dependent methyltransferase